jgi:biopolymer transport protein ExbD
MPSVKIPRKSTWTDMTPFVDVAFLILAFFIMATKFKPQEPVKITTPQSVSSQKLKEQDAVLISFDSTGKVYMTVNVQKTADEEMKYDVIKNLSQSRNLGLSEAAMRNFQKNAMIGSPFSQLNGVLSKSNAERDRIKQTGIPVDSTNNELQYWINSAKLVFAGKKVGFMIKGDNNAKYPSFKGVIDAFRANDIFKFQLITDPRGVPEGSELYQLRQQGKGQQAES